MTISSTGIRPEGSQESDAMPVHYGSLAPVNGWAHSLFGQAHACWVTSGRWSLLANSSCESMRMRRSRILWATRLAAGPAGPPQIPPPLALRPSSPSDVDTSIRRYVDTSIRRYVDTSNQRSIVFTLRSNHGGRVTVPVRAPLRASISGGNLRTVRPPRWVVPSGGDTTCVAPWWAPENPDRRNCRLRSPCPDDRRWSRTPLSRT